MFYTISLFRLQFFMHPFLLSIDLRSFLFITRINDELTFFVSYNSCSRRCLWFCNSSLRKRTSGSTSHLFLSFFLWVFMHIKRRCSSSLFKSWSRCCCRLYNFWRFFNFFFRNYCYCLLRRALAFSFFKYRLKLVLFSRL